MMVSPRREGVSISDVGLQLVSHRCVVRRSSVPVDEKRDDPTVELSIEKTELDPLRSYAEYSRSLHHPLFFCVGGSHVAQFQEWLFARLPMLLSA